MFQCFYSLVTLAFKLPFNRKCVKSFNLGDGYKVYFLKLQVRSFRLRRFLDASVVRNDGSVRSLYLLCSYNSRGLRSGLALESMVTLLTIKYIQVFLILWIISKYLWPIKYAT